MNEPTQNPNRGGDLVRTANHLLTGNRRAGRATRVAGAVIDHVLEKEGGKMTGRVVVALLVLLAVAGLAFVAYRLLVLDLILTVIRERD
jgi:hypothetical protein